MANFVSQKGILNKNTQPQTTNSEDYINQYIQSQMQSPNRPYQATMQKPVPDFGDTVPNASDLASKGDWLGAIGTGVSGLLNAKSNVDSQNQQYNKSSAGQYEQANAATDPYLRAAYLQQGQQAQGNESAQAAAYNDLLKEQGKNALEGVKFKGQQELEKSKMAQEAQQNELNRNVQYSNQNIDRSKLQKDTIEGLYGEGQKAGLKGRDLEQFVQSKMSGKGEAVKEGFGEKIARHAGNIGRGFLASFNPNDPNSQKQNQALASFYGMQPPRQ